MRIGFGYDVHAFCSGRRFILGGTEIPFEKGLLGHSDADALTHAVIDALLGAAALGDIGTHFSDKDPLWEGADSLDLLRKTVQKLADAGFCPVNVDTTVVCQQPKLGPYKEEMQKRLANALGLSVCDVSIKAKTEENLGFTGAGDGVKAYAVCLIKRA